MSRIKLIEGLMMGLGLILFAAILNVNAASDATFPLNSVSNELELQFTVTMDSSEANPSPPATDTVDATQVEQFTVNVDGGGDAPDAFTSVIIERSTHSDGTKKDAVTFTPDKAQEAVIKAAESGRNTARILVLDIDDTVSEVNVMLPKATLRTLYNGNLKFEIFTENVRLLLPLNAIDGIDEDLYFRFIPIKTEPLRQEVQERAKKEEIVRDLLGEQGISVIARPMTIETNLSSRAVELVMPLRNVELPTDTEQLDEFLAALVIFIEHSDGDRELVIPEPIVYQEGLQGLKFTVTKFSTFTILNTEHVKLHRSYMNGYPDLSFRPDRGISRAETAAILSRIGAASQTKKVEQTYTDISTNHWAYTAINEASSAGLVIGYPDGSFAPERQVTRAEMIVIVSRWLMPGDNSPIVSRLSDIEGHWAQEHIARSEQAGIVSGLPDGTFLPDRPITRAETVALLNRILDRGPLSDRTTQSWKDVPANHWAFGDINEASVTHNSISDILAKQ